MVMAKGVEDCAFYRWSRLTSLNEVGGDPSIFAVDADEFHDAMAAPAARAGRDAMTTLSTHDTKRGEDVRARITVLAEVPDAWERALDELLAPRARARPGLRHPALAGRRRRLARTGRPRATRLHGYAEKAMREAGDRTQWTEPDEAYEAAVHAAVDAAFDDRGRARRVGRGLAARRSPARLEQRARRQAARAHDAGRAGRLPGQRAVGAVAWSTPTTAARSTSTHARRCSGRHRRALTAAYDDAGAAKLLVTRAGADPAARPARALHRLRRRSPPTGEAADHALAFDRGGAITVVTRLPRRPRRGAAAGATPPSSLPAGQLDRRCSRARLHRPTCLLADLLGDLPVALLVRRTAADSTTTLRGPLRRLGAAPAARAAQRVGDERGADAPATPTAGGPPTARCPTGEVDYGYLLDDAPTPLPGPALAPAARRRARAVAHLRPARRTTGATPPGPAASSPGR